MVYALAKSDKIKAPTMFKLICHIEETGVERVIGCFMMGKNVDEMM